MLVFIIFECKGNARYYTTVGYMNYCIKYCMAAHNSHFKLIQFPVCTHVGVLYSSEILPQACEKHIQIRSSI